MENKQKNTFCGSEQSIYLQVLIIWNFGSILKFYQVLSLKSNFQKPFVFCYWKNVVMISFRISNSV